MVNVPTSDEHGALASRVSALEAEMVLKSAEIGGINSSLDNLNARVAALEVTAVEHGIELDALSSETAQLDSRLTTLDGEVVATQSDIDALEARVTALEIPVPSPEPPPPSSLTGLDISTSIVGSTVETAPASDYDVLAEGLDIYGTADSFRFSYKQLSGNFDQIVRVHAFTGPDAGAKAGLMARESLDATSRNVFMGATISNNGYRFQHRGVTGGSTVKVEGGTVAYPNVWVRLRRQGDVFTGYVSIDGFSWTQYGQVTLVLPSQLYIGLAVNSRSAGNTASAQCRALGNMSPQTGAYTPSGPITAVSGQTITGVRIAGVGGTAITVRDVQDVTIIDVQIEETGGHGILIQNSHNVKVLNSLIKPVRTKTTLDTQHAVCVRDSTGVLVQGNVMRDFESGVHVVGGHSVWVKGNYGENPRGPFPRGQHVQMYPCNRDGIEANGPVIEHNYFVSDEGSAPVDDKVGVEDSINIGSRTMYAKVLNNFIIGGRAYSGCGIVLEGGVDHGLVKGNTLIRTSQCGVNIVASAWCVVEENKVLDTSLVGASGNVGLSSWFHSGDTRSHDNIFRNNIVSNKRPDGTYGDIYIKSGSATQSNNTKGDAARALLTPEAEKMPPPPIPPVPWTP